MRFPSCHGVYEFFGCSINIPCRLLLLYNNSKDARFFLGFTGTITHSWLTNQSAGIDLVIIQIIILSCILLLQALFHIFGSMFRPLITLNYRNNAEQTSFVGYFIYAETSWPRKSGQTTRLVGGPFSGIKCMRFYYHMYGRHIADLQIYLSEAGMQSYIWGRYKNQGNTWRYSNVTVFGNNYTSWAWVG